MSEPSTPVLITDAARQGNPDGDVHVLLAHGAGAGASSPFMTTMARLLAARGLTAHRFEFAYMAARLQGGKRRPPPRADTLVDEYRAAVAAVPAGARLIIGGKSMGGRVASLVADELFAAGQICGLVCLGYPFHPPNKPAQLRTSHLQALACPTLIIQGERDPFGGRDDVDGYSLSQQIAFHWAGDGDHDLGPRGGSGFTRSGNLEAAADAIAAFASRLEPKPRKPSASTPSAPRSNRPAGGATPGRYSRRPSRRSR
jgi:predicted alpha/beta-hydrolase family hydrolase